MVWHADEEEDVDILTLDPTLMQEEDPDSLRYLPVHILPHSPPEALDPDKGGTCPSYLSTYGDSSIRVPRETP